jgi:hypothetical protein
MFRYFDFVKIFFLLQQGPIRTAREGFLEGGQASREQSCHPITSSTRWTYDATTYDATYDATLSALMTYFGPIFGNPPR